MKMSDLTFRPFVRHGRLLALALAIAGISSASAQETKRITYDEHVLPIFREKCVSCHGPDKKRSGLALHTYLNTMEGGSSGVCVKPGDPDGSFLFKVMAHKEEPFMPPNSPPLPADKLAVIEKWIAGGAPENAGSKVTVTAKTADIGLKSVVRGKPEGPPPMPPKNLSLEPVVCSERANAITALAANPWSPLVAVAGQRQVLLYDAGTCSLLGILPFPEGEIHVLKYSRNGSLLLAAGGHPGKSGRVVVWSVATGQRVVEVGEETDCVLAADISPDQTRIALGGPGKTVRVYTTADQQLAHEIRKHTDWVTAMEFSPDGVLLATGDRNGGLHVWEAFTAREFYALRGHTAMITEVSWRADSNVLASASEDASVRLWNMENGSQIRTWGAHGGGTLSVAFGADGRLVTAGRDRTVKTWDGNGGAQKTFPAFPDLALKAVFSHDQARVIGGDWTGQVLVWAAADAKPVGQLDASPPSAAQQLEGAVKELIAATARRDQLAAPAKASQDASAKAAADLAAAQKAVADSAATVKAATDAVAAARTRLDQATAALAPLQADVQARELLGKVLTEAADKVKAEADKAPANKALAAAHAKAREHATAAANDLAAARKAIEAATAAVKTATDEHAAAQKKLTEVQAAVAALPRMVEAKTAAAKAAADKAAADRTALDQATAAVTALSAKVDQLKASLVAPPK